LPELREVRIPIGKQDYPMQTELDDDTFKRVIGIVDEACSVLDKKIEQEKLLVLVCLQLAYKLEKFSGALEAIDKRLNELKPDVHKS